MKDRIYLCCYSTGEYDDYGVVIVFATTNKSKAKRWVSKFNKIIEKWRCYYSQYEEYGFGFTWIKSEYYEKYYDRWHSIHEINNAFIEEIELR